MQDHTAEDEIGKSSIKRAKKNFVSLCVSSRCFPCVVLIQSLSSLSYAPVTMEENSPFVADVEIFLVRRVGLDSQAGGENELADGGAEAGEERVEGL